jgi:Uncharacterized protein conserved in bacteria (DUF2325)
VGCREVKFLFNTLGYQLLLTKIDIGVNMKTSMQLKQFVSETFSTENIGFNKILPKAITNPIKRAKLWELDEIHHCPVIGACLATDDLVRFARRFNFSSTLRDEYSLHIEAVRVSKSNNPVAKAIQKHLDNKYRYTINHFNQAKSDNDVKVLWKEFYVQGKCAGAMWAALTHKMASEETRQTIYVDMHMLSHQVGAGQAADIRKLNRLEMENAEVKEALELQQQRHAVIETKLQQKLDKTTKELVSQRQSNNDIVKLQARINQLESGVAMTEMGRRLMALTTVNAQLRKAAERIASLENALEAAYDGAKALVHERNTLAAERNVLENLLRTELREIKKPDKNKMLSVSPLENSYVLCVGGRVSLLPEYRAVAKKLGILLLHHDGGQQEALSRLPDLVNRANAVVCPTDCVSHAAYYLLKRQCKRNNKQCLLFKGASISNFAKVLTQFSSGQVRRSDNAIMKLQ